MINDNEWLRVYVDACGCNRARQWFALFATMFNMRMTDTTSISNTWSFHAGSRVVLVLISHRQHNMTHQHLECPTTLKINSTDVFLFLECTCNVFWNRCVIHSHKTRLNSRTIIPFSADRNFATPSRRPPTRCQKLIPPPRPSDQNVDPLSHEKNTILIVVKLRPQNHSTVITVKLYF